MASNALPASIAALPRPVVHDLIEMLIARLDLEDGDCDLEEDDPSGDTLDEHGEDDPSTRLEPPIYGIDQSRGPLNEAIALQAYQERMNRG